MAVVLMGQKFKAISVMQLYFLETQQSSFLCQPLYQKSQDIVFVNAFLEAKQAT